MPLVDGSFVGKSTLSTEEVAHDIRLAIEYRKSNVIFSTYASFDTCVSGVHLGLLEHKNTSEVHLLADEAHYFTRGEDSEDGADSFKVLRDSLRLFNTRFFFTATPKEYEDRDDGSGMNNTDIYGRVIYEIKPRELIKRGVICEPRIDRASLPSNIDCENLDKYSGDFLLRTVSKHERIINGTLDDPNVLRGYGEAAAKVLVAVEGSKQLYSMIHNGFYEKARGLGWDVAWTMAPDEVGTFYNGKEYGTDEFLEILKDRAKDDLRRIVLLHYRKLTEGIDIPSMTGLIVLRDMNKVAKIQNIGRVLRVHPSDKEKEFSDRSVSWIKPCAYIIVPDIEGISLDSLVRDLVNDYDSRIQIESVETAIGLGESQPELQNREYKLTPFKSIDGKIIHSIESYTDFQDDVIEQIDANEEIDIVLGEEADVIEPGNGVPRISSLKDKKCENVRKLIFGDCPHAKEIRTPYYLCEDIVNKLPDLSNKRVLVLFNPEFYLVAKDKYPQAKFVLVTGSKAATEKRFKNIEELVWCNPHDFRTLEDGIGVLEEMNKFDVVIGNPPYQGGTTKSDPLWEKFVEKSFELCKEGGYVSLIHPCAWRKPEHKLFSLLQEYDIEYLEIHDQKDGLKTFDAGTRYDWYICRKIKNSGNTVVVDEIGTKTVCDLRKMKCIPHRDIEWFSSLLAKEGEERCEVIYSRSAYGTEKEWMSYESVDEFIYPCIHATRCGGPRTIYSSTNQKGLFGIKKVIMGKASPENGFFDIDGKYGMSEDVFAVGVETDEKGHYIEQLLRSDSFKKLTKLCKWAGFKTDHLAFSLFRKDFWKDFI
jgi:hypothetical protein